MSNEEISLMVKNFTSSTRIEAKKEAQSLDHMMKRDLLVVIETATIVEDPDTSQMSVQLPTREEKNLQEEEQEMSHLGEREGVEMIVMNEDPLGEARI